MKRAAMYSIDFSPDIASKIASFCFATMPAIRRARRIMEIGLIAGVQCFTDLFHMCFMISARMNGINITFIRARDISRKLTAISVPAVNCRTRGIVNGASREVEIVRMRASPCPPPLISESNGSVMPDGIAARSKRASASSGIISSVITYVATGKRISIKMFTTRSIFMAFRYFTASRKFILRAPRKKMAPRSSVLILPSSFMPGIMSPAASVTRMIAK